MQGNNLSEVQELALEFLGFLEGRERMEREAKSSRRFQELMTQVVKASLVASGQYEEKVLFEEHFPQSDEPTMGLLPATDDADVNFDYGNVEWDTPDEDEMAMLQQLLSNDVVHVPGLDVEPPPAPSAPAVPAMSSSGTEQIDNDREWV